MKKLVIIGDGDQSRVIQSILSQTKDFKLFYFIKLNNQRRNKDKFLPGVKKIKIDKFLLKKNTNYYFICSISNNYLRYKIVNKFNQKFKKIKWVKLVSKSASVSKFSKIGQGTVIGDGSYIGPETKIGDHCFINNNSKIEHHNKFDNFSSTAPGVITGGNVNLKQFSYIGLAGVVKNNITISENTIIGAKSLVLKNCKANSTYFGTPAKFKAKRTKGKKYI